ncbi:MAG: hypothetical protein NT167_20795 [Verrucomicrobia bacterium]|nr:hypothetical protein [Verrucomicrobiota bacterium]
MNKTPSRTRRRQTLTARLVASPGLIVCAAAALLGLLVVSSNAASSDKAINLRDAVVVTRPGDMPLAEQSAATVLIEEVEKRTGIRLHRSTSWPAGKVVIAITSSTNIPGWGREIPQRAGTGLPETRAEGYRIWVENGKVVWVVGADARATLFGVGQLLRRLDWARGKLSLPGLLDLATAPAYPIRGHQLGYRATANSYDAWDVAQFDQYIRELTFFGVNSIEGIPWHDSRPSPVMKLPRRQMNQAISGICERYGLDYWAWIPADFELTNTTKRAEMLDRCEQFFKDSKVFSGFFFPGGDPGDNPPELVLPFLEDVWKRLQPIHPAARIWLSLQSFKTNQAEFVYRYVEEKRPEWLAGLVVGPSSPPAAATRQRLPAPYKLRLYPDVTHNKLSQFEVPDWDQAYALTLGREAVNPRPAEFAAIHNRFAPLSDGFISYSDGVHDDVNKTIWSAMSWDPLTPVRDVMVDYARVFFQPALAQKAADGILALEDNWRGPLVDNGAVEATYLMWRQLEHQAPRLEGNWRWQMCRLRANYDAYVRHRLIYETSLEQQANLILAEAGQHGADKAMNEALAVLNRAVNHPVSPNLRHRIEALCELLFRSIGLQTSVPKYHASGYERGAVLDFVDRPLNNRWWLEDEFGKVRGLGSETEKCRRLEALAAWENPGPGSYYDSVGYASKSPHMFGVEIRPSELEDPRDPQPTYWWWDDGKSRARLSWQLTMWPKKMVYEGLDPQATYVVRSSGYGPALLRINGQHVEPTLDGNKMGEFKEYPVPADCVKGRRLVLTWDPPVGIENIGWRQQPRLAEVWLLKR